MKEIKRLHINIIDGDVNKYLHVFYEDIERAEKELARWRDTYRAQWNVPDAPDERWGVIKVDSRAVRFVGRAGKHRIFSGDVFNENYIIEDGEEIFDLNGNVFRYVNHSISMVQTVVLG